MRSGNHETVQQCNAGHVADSISASPTSEAVTLSTGTPISAQRTCRRRCRDAYNRPLAGRQPWQPRNCATVQCRACRRCTHMLASLMGQPQATNVFLFLGAALIRSRCQSNPCVEPTRVHNAPRSVEEEDPDHPRRHQYRRLVAQRAAMRIFGICVRPLATAVPCRACCGERVVCAWWNVSPRTVSRLRMRHLVMLP